MSEEEIRKQILIALQYSYRHDDWVNPVSEALDGVTAAEAAWRPGPEGKCIWDIVLHLAVWTENIVERMRTGERARPAEGAWPEPPAVPEEVAWGAAKQRLERALADLERYIESHSLEEMVGGYGLADLFCRFVHNGYHLGQITKMRELGDRGGIQ